MSYDVINAKLRPLHDNVLVHNMDMGEMITSSGIVINSDDGKAHGVKPRWAQVYKIGPEQRYLKEGEWVLIEHGRWTRKIKIDDGESIKEIQKIEWQSVLATSDQKPNDVYIGEEFSHGSTASFDPAQFV
jgi:co-chaperonin GroES (HSP10)